MTHTHIIKNVLPGSIAEELEISAGDKLLAINDQEIEDVFDYHFLANEEYLTVLIEKPDGEQWELEIEKEYEEDLGIEFEQGLMDEYRSCRNKCIFCFIDQMPKDMRETLYFKDDDSRLSFLQGNYVTLTNMSDHDIDRIVRYHLEPINISFHTMNPELRCRMLHNRFAGEKLKFLDQLYEHQIEMNGQIVCCRHVNDGAELERTIDDLAGYLPFMRSVSVVPAGITKYREGLYPLELFSKAEAEAVIDLIESRQKKYFEEYGLHFIHASDEWYFLAEREFPEEERYDGYIQLENGVGMMRLFCSEFQEALRAQTEAKDYPEKREELKRDLTIATGKLAYPMVKGFAGQLQEAFPGLHIFVKEIENRFFGETITVSGLITGRDLTEQLLESAGQGEKLGDTLLIPENMLRMGEQVFLDDMTLQEAEEKLGMRVIAVDAPGGDFVRAALDPAYGMDRENDRGRAVYIQAFDRIKEE